jgi:arylsulfatase A-like enzyme/tetratricopeptide (TPR) repeat protein
VVLISLDTFRADRLAPWGASPDSAPTLNALAAKGTVFTGCFAPAPLTLPSHATLLTGAFPEKTGLRDNGFGRLSAELPTLAEVLSSRGYTTAAIVAAPVLDRRYGLARGFSTYDDSLGQVVSRTAQDITDRALARLGAARKGPLFLFVHYFDTHFPYAAPPAYARRSSGGPYEGAVAYVDAEVGRLLKALPADTVVAVISDHGEGLGDHGEPTHGVFLFQATVRVVCFLQGPGVPAGKTCVAPASLADVAPTLAVLAGVPASALRGDGADLLALSRAGAAPQRAFPLESWPPFSQFRWRPLFGVTDGRYKWIRGRVDRLYDLSTDPGEVKDLASAPPAGALPLRDKIPAPPTSAPSEGRVDPALLGLGYAPAPGGRLDPMALPDPHDKAFILQDIDQARLDRAGGRFGQAVARLQTASERDPGNPTVWFEFGETLRRAGRSAEAVTALERALSLSPQVYQAWTSKGHALAAQGRGEEAAGCYEKALRLQPDYTAAADALAAYYLEVGRSDEALSLIERTISAGMADAITYLLRGQVRLSAGRKADAERDFQAAVKLSSQPERTLKEAGDIYMEHRMHEDGRRLYLEGIRRCPTYAPNHVALGGHYLQEGRPDEALPYFQKALECNLDPRTRESVRRVVTELGGPSGPAGAK